MTGDPSSSARSAGSGPRDESGKLADTRVIEQWYSQQVEWLRVFVFGILRDNELVSDVLQTVFRKALESGGAVEPQSVRAWLTKVASNEALLFKRKQGVIARAMTKSGASEFDSASLPLEGLMKRETAAKVQRAVSRLPQEQRIVVERRIQGEQTFAEIALELGVPLGTVLTRMRLALGKLKQALADEAVG